jgi:hypothetical protein
MMNSPEAITAYFEKMVTDSATNAQFAGLVIISFIEGDSRRLIEQSRSELTYPCLFVEIPSFVLGQNFKSNQTGSTRFGVSILYNSEVGDYAQQRIIRQQAYLTILRILGQLQKDSLQMGFYVQLDNTPIEPINSWFVDNDYGYRAEINLEKIGFVNLNICS